jgi:hypothetical protein
VLAQFFPYAIVYIYAFAAHGIIMVPTPPGDTHASDLNFFHTYTPRRSPVMPTAGMDRIPMPTAYAERLLAFYKRLEFPMNNEDKWRAGEIATFSIQVGEYSKISVHPKGYTASLRGPTAVPGCTDICFVYEGTVEECQQRLADAGVEIIRGPVARPGGRGRGLAPSLSLYARDPKRQSVGMNDLSGTR